MALYLAAHRQYLEKLNSVILNSLLLVLLLLLYCFCFTFQFSGQAKCGIFGSMTKDWTCTSCVERRHFNHRTRREVPQVSYIYIFQWIDTRPLFLEMTSLQKYEIIFTSYFPIIDVWRSWSRDYWTWVKTLSSNSLMLFSEISSSRKPSLTIWHR